MAYCIDETGEYAVSPALVSSCCPDRCLLETTFCTPYLPRCSKKPLICQEIQPQSKCSAVINKKSKYSHNCCSDCCDRPVSPIIANSPTRRLTPECCNSCCNSPCKPVKTKYVIPCYRYEDGRIINQPTALMRRACEVAVGNTKRRKPFIESSYSADPEQEVRRYVSQDERGNCCYHLEKKKHDFCPERCWSSQSCPRCEDCVQTKSVSPGTSYYYVCPT